MSKRLNYLAKARPEAATAYLTFLKESGKYLDDKTRFLISVVTKVVSGTKSGLKQYVPHAMRCGATPNEIVDAVLMAMPAADLPRVLDALDWLQEIDPAFKIENLFKEAQWYEVCKLTEIPEKTLTAKDVQGFGVLVYKDGEQIWTYDRKCPHLGTKLPETCEGDRMTCPRHKWVFEIPSGKVLEEGSRDLHDVPHKVEGDTLMVKVLILDED
ncbi:MAG: Rieske 2Fe-2S domain-containing protein [bacterium]|nr:Rieske 2Fe-2S domain-containing protein [bacterium]